MFNLKELEQLIAFSELGTLAKVAEKFLISSPSLSRSMQHLEDDFGVALFDRSTNKITLNETGLKAVEVAKEIISVCENALHDVQEFDAKLNSITISSVAPAPLYNILTELSSYFPGMTISHKINDTDDILKDIECENVDLAILPYNYTEKDYKVKELITENLYIAVPRGHELSEINRVNFQDINGFNFIVRSKIGFWSKLIKNKMPDSKFLFQNSSFEFEELVKSSTIPRFITDFSSDFKNENSNRINIPIMDNEAKVTYYLVILDKKLNKYFTD